MVKRIKSIPQWHVCELKLSDTHYTAFYILQGFTQRALCLLFGLRYTPLASPAGTFPQGLCWLHLVGFGQWKLWLELKREREGSGFYFPPSLFLSLLCEHFLAVAVSFPWFSLFTKQNLFSVALTPSEQFPIWFWNPPDFPNVWILVKTTPFPRLTPVPRGVVVPAISFDSVLLQLISICFTSVPVSSTFLAPA